METTPSTKSTAPRVRPTPSVKTPATKPAADTARNAGAQAANPPKVQ